MNCPQRKHPRLKAYDYSLPGYYYVTLHIAPDAPLLSSVGRGLAPAGAVVSLSAAGQIARQQLFALEARYSNVVIDKYIIMPTHIHVIIRLTEKTEEGISRPRLMDVIGAYKSLTTRACNHAFHTPGRKLFQTSFYETVLRNEKAYQECWHYIDANPSNWLRNPEDI